VEKLTLQFPDKSRIALKNIFLAFLKIGTFAFGGVYSMLAFFDREIVEKRKWLNRDEFSESIVIGQMTPGAPIVNTGIFIGYSLRRLKGAVVTVAGLVLPSFVLVLILSFFYVKYREAVLVRGALKGVSAAVVGLIASVVIGMGRKAVKHYIDILFILGGFLGLFLFRINPIILIIGAAAGGRGEPEMAMLKFLWTLFYINLFTIGGGYVMIPLLQREVVENYHWMTNREFIDSIAVGQLTPGPLTIMNAFIGYKIFGFPGSFGAVVSSYLPSVILVTVISRYYLEVRNSRLVSSAFRGITPAVAGLLAAVLITLGKASVSNIPALAIALSSFALVSFKKTDPTLVILGAGILGALIF
jgi:chromate transporter